jgi:Cu2+-exporting ATPase
VGQGVSLQDGSEEWRLGRGEWAAKSSINGSSDEPDAERSLETVLTRSGGPVGIFRFQESARADAVEEIARLRTRKLEIIVLSGDRKHKVEELLNQLGLPLDAGCGEMTPHEKAEWLQTHGAGDALMLGDGANDSLAFDQALCRGTPVVHRSVLAEKSDFYYLGRGIAGIRALFEVNQARRRTQAWLLAFSIAYNLLAVGLAVCGHMNPLLAAILMPVSSLLTLAIVGAGMRRTWRGT